MARQGDVFRHDEEPSQELLAAQKRLEQLRAKVTGGQWSAVSGQWSMIRDLVAGGESQAASSKWRVDEGEQLQEPEPEQVDPDLPPFTITLHPSLALGMLRMGQAAAGRLWLLLRYLDKDGKGWLPLNIVQEKLTVKNAELRVCGRRQLRNLLRQGGGLFWKRDKERIWLKSAARVAVALGIERLSGRPVKLPVNALLGGIGQVRAHLYASFHSGRANDNPISRAKLRQITQVPERTQRLYEHETRVIRRSNFAVGEIYKDEHSQERAWRHGRGTFKFVDRHGRIGPASNCYIAWRLPNSYEGPHETGPRGRQKKINQQIDLVNSRAQGNDLHGGSLISLHQRLFHQDGQGAAKSYNRNAEADAYWAPSCRGRSRGRHEICPLVWHVIPGRLGASSREPLGSPPELEVL